MKNLLLTVLVVGLVVLAWHPGNGVRAAAERSPMRAVVVDAIEPLDQNQAAARIDAVSIEDDALFVDVTYTGGCKVHDFKLVVSTGVLDGTPSRAGAALVQRGYGDRCETAVSESLRFDLSPVKEALAENTDDGQIVLILGENELRYVY